jgi:branched-chain amino acid transport system substrate-binding protein
MKRSTIGLLGLIAISAAVAFGGISGANAGFSRNKVTLLVVTDLSSVNEAMSGPGTVEAVKMAIEDFGGNINGVPINLLVVDTKNDVAIASSKTEELIKTEGVDAIFDVPNSAAAIAVVDIAKRYKVTTVIVTSATTAITNEHCNKYSWHYSLDTYALSKVAATKITQLGAKKWYTITADYAFGHSFYDNYKKNIEAVGGKIIGNDMVPFPNEDFSTYLLKAKAANPDAIAFLNSGPDTVNAMKQAGEFGLRDGKIRIVPALVYISDVDALGADAWAGSTIAVPWYWNMDAQARAWSDRFQKRAGNRPTSLKAANYSAATQILKTMQRLNTDDADAIAQALEDRPFEDFFIRHGKWRKYDHRVLHDMYLAEIKAAKDVKEPQDYFKIIATVPGEQAFMPLSESTCKHDW